MPGKYTRVAVALMGLALAACATERIPVGVPFDPREAAFIEQPGSAVITGQGFMRQLGGGVVTCAGEQATLIPATAYATARMRILYGNVEAGRRPLTMMSAPEEAPPEYLRLTRTSTCDAQGNFRFDNLPPGQYFLTVPVRWVAGSAPQGGTLMRRVTVAPAQNQTVLLSS